MSWPLMKLTIKQNYKLFLVFIAVLSMYITVIISMYDPEGIEELIAMFDVMPKEMMSAFAFDGAITSLTSFLASWLYGFIMVLFPAIFSMLLGHKLVAKSVDNGSMACLLTTPDSRKKVIITKAMFAVGSIILLQVFATVLAIVICNVNFSGELEVAAFIKLNITSGLLCLTTMAITFFFSSLFNNASYSMLCGAGVPLLSFIFNMLNGISPDVKIFEKISYFAWYDAVEIVKGASTFGVNLIYLGISLVLFLASFYIFNKKQLPL